MRCSCAFWPILRGSASAEPRRYRPLTIHSGGENGCISKTVGGTLAAGRYPAQAPGAQLAGPDQVGIALALDEDSPGKERERRPVHPLAAAGQQALRVQNPVHFIGGRRPGSPPPRIGRRPRRRETPGNASSALPARPMPLRREMSPRRERTARCTCGAKTSRRLPLKSSAQEIQRRDRQAATISLAALSECPIPHPRPARRPP